MRIVGRYEQQGDFLFIDPAFESNAEQAVEFQTRTKIAKQDYSNYLDEVSRHHSLPVMDAEVKRFVDSMPLGATVVDIGGCWGWHWRNLWEYRPDIKVYIVDFVKENLSHAKKVLEGQINKNIFLVHGDATQLQFTDQSFDGYWSVQTLQHIPKYDQAVHEAYRVLKPGGSFASYSLTDKALTRFLFTIFGKNYVSKGTIPGAYYLARASQQQREIIEKRFQNAIEVRYTEKLFEPSLKITAPGRYNFLGRLDQLLSSTDILNFLARQTSFHVTKH